MFYTRPAVWKKFGTQVKVAHFAGFEKPWKHRMSADDGAICQAINRLESSDTIYTTAEQSGIVALWWAVFFKCVKNQLGNGMFLSTTFEPVPPPPPPPSPQDNRPEDQEFWNQNEKYHPEFDDNSFDFLHTNQRVDESNRYGMYHEFFEPPKPPEPEHHKYYESHHHNSHGHQPPVYNEHHQCHQNECQYQPPQFKPSFEKCHHQENRHEEPQEWHQDQPQQHQWQDQPQPEHHSQLEYSPPPSAPMKQPCGEHHEHNQEIQHHPPPGQTSPQRQCETSSPTSPPGSRNDKDPLFFAKKPMCRECLRELQWSRQFFDFLHRDIPISMSPTYFRSRVRPPSHPKSLPGQQTIHGVLKNSPTPSTNTILDGDNSKINAREHKKGDKKKEKGLHQVHKGKSVPKKRLKKPADSSKLIDAAKRRIQAKTENTGPTDKTSVEPMEKIKASPIKNVANKEKERKSEIILAPISRSALTRRSEVSEDNQLEEARPRLGTVTPPASVTRAKRQIKPLGGPQKAEMEALISMKITSTETPTARGSIELPETDEVVKSKAYPELESEPELNTAIDLKVPSLPKPEERKTKMIVQEELQSIQKAESVKEMTIQKTEPKERMKQKIDNVEAKQVVEKPVVDSTPWLPRAKKPHFRPQKQFSGHEYFCDRHRPHPPPPQWKMFAWERGEIDYMGSDRFSNILARIRSTIQQSNDNALPIGVWL
nr:glycogenin 1 [Hymenolepis microstoma]